MISGALLLIGWDVSVFLLDLEFISGTITVQKYVITEICDV